MNSKRALRKLEESLDNIRSITRVFEHTAARKMDINRHEIARLGDYVKEAQESYSYAKIAIAGRHSDANVILRTAYRVPKKRKVVILVTSETKYVGNLINSLVSQFVSDFEFGDADGIVVGETGRNLLDKNGFDLRRVLYFDFEDDKPDWNVISRVSEEIGNYLEVVIIWGKYKSILTQELERTDIGKSVVVNRVAKAKKYGFETRPSLPLALLEKQIIASVFMQKLYESGLTKNAVQVKILEIGAIAERINAAMGQLAKYKLRLNKDTNNRKQTQLFSSRNIWEKGGVFTNE